METALGWITAVIGAAGSLLGLAATRGGGEGAGAAPAARRAAALATVVGAIVLFLLTRPTEAPFSLGQRLGWGILIGGLLGTAAGLCWTGRSVLGAWSSNISAAGVSSMALLGAGVMLLIFGDYPQPALGGFVIGALLAALIFRLAVDRSDSMELWALSATALGASILLASFRYGMTGERFWWRAPLILIAAAIASHLAGAGLTREGRGFGRQAFVGSLITVVLALIFAWRLFPNWMFFWTALAGVVTWALVAWLAASSPESPAAGAAAAMTVVAFSALGFRLLGGFGIGVGLLAAWPILLSALASITRAELEEDTIAARAVICAGVIGVGAMLYRLFLENYSWALKGFDLRAHYAFVALMLGAVFPFVLAAFFPLGAKGGLRRVVGAVGIGFFSAAGPLVILVIWDFRAAIGFLTGSVAAEVFLLLWSLVGGRPDWLRAPVLILAGQVALVQLGQFFGPFAETTRLIRVIVFAAAVLIGLAWAALSSRWLRSDAEEG